VSGVEGKRAAMIFPLVSGPSPLDTPPLPTAPKVNEPKDNIQAPKSLIEGELFSTNLDHMILEALLVFIKYSDIY
jgi:hypothetical protein